MSNKGLQQQDPFLNCIRKECIFVNVYLVNGIKLQGHIHCFDQFCIILKNQGVKQLIFKHAISTVVPTKNCSHTHCGGHQNTRSVTTEHTESDESNNS